MSTKLIGWTIKVTEQLPPSIAATTYHDSKTIFLNAGCLEEYISQGLLADLLAHEFAHAMLPPEAKHRGIWKRICRHLGAKPTAQYYLA